jgi:hypothetical protein
VGSSRQLQRPPGLVGATLSQIDPRLLTRLRQWREAIENRWNQNVLNYSRGRQFELLRQLGFETPSGEDLLRVLGYLVVVAGLAGAAWTWRGRRRGDPWLRLQQRVAARLARLGVEVAASDPPRARAARVRELLGARGEALARVLEALERLRYAPAQAGEDAGAARPPPRWWAQFARAAREARAARP